MSSSPTLRSRTCRLGPKGSTTKGTITGAKTSTGPSTNSSQETGCGVMSSLATSLTPSTMVCSRPKGPTSLGPMRNWMWAATLRSAHTRNMALTWMNNRTNTSPSTRARISGPRNPATACPRPAM